MRSWETDIAIKPIYYETDPRTGNTLWGLSPYDGLKIMQGYGCPKCLEDYNGLYMVTCPVCGHSRDSSNDFAETPAHFMPGEAAPAPEGF